MRAATTGGRVDDPDELVKTIVAALAGLDGTYVELVPGGAPDLEKRIALVRSCGRGAGRLMGLRVQTVATDEHGIIRLGGLAIATQRSDGARDVQVINAGPRN